MNKTVLEKWGNDGWELHSLTVFTSALGEIRLTAYLNSKSIVYQYPRI